MASIDENTALLLYRVGPVFCASPCQPISSIITPPPLTRPPGSDSAQPGIFKHADAIVRSLDLRYKFGVDESHWAQPGRTVITQLAKHHIGFYVDEILDVISMPRNGWGALPALLPRGVFTRTLTLQERIYLYADFNNLQRIPDSGYLRQYIEHLIETKQKAQAKQETATYPPKLITKSEVTRPTTNSVNSDKASDTSTRPTSLANKKSVPTSNQLHRTSQKAKTINPVVAHNDRTNHIMPESKVLKDVTPSPHHETVKTKQQHSIDKTSRASTLKQQDITNSTKSTTTPLSGQTSSSGVRHRTTSPVAKPAPATNASITTYSSDTNNHSGMLFISLVFFLAVISGGIWYLFDDESDILITPDVSSSDINDVPDQPMKPEREKPAEITATAALPETPTQSVHKQDVTPPETQVQSEQVTQHSPEKGNKAEPEIEGSIKNKPDQEYHASIEKDSQGMTITLDVPEDDPAFTQTADTTSANDIKADEIPENTVSAQSGDNPDSTPPASKLAVEKKPQKIEIIHIVARGDTLWAIAKRYVKNPFRYPELARLSKIKNPDLIYPGDRVRIIKQQKRAKPNK